MGIVFKNNAKTTLASNLSNSATSATVTDGSVFPTLGAGEFFLITFDDGTNNEICKCTARSSNTLTIVRAQDNTSARAFSSGDAAEGRVTAGVLETIQENIAAKSANQTVYNATTASSATAYNIGIDPGVEANAMVFLDGVMQHHDTFSFSGSTLTFDAAPVDGTKLEVIVDNLINLQSSNLTVDTFTAADVGGSAQTDFTLSDTPAAETNLIVFVEGVFQDQDAYTISSNTLSITTGVIAGRGVTVYVINPVNIGTPSDGTITSAKLSGNLTLPGTLTVGANDVAFDSPTFVVDNSNSRVGLGTASPTVPVDIVGDVKMSANLTVDTTTLVIDSTNNKVGIGTSSPSHVLTAKSDANTNPAIKVEQTGSTDGWGFIPDNTNGNLEFSRIGGGTAGTHLTITNDGNVGIGVTSPEGKFEIEDGGTSKSILQKITLDNDDVYGLVVGNDSYSTTLADGLAVTVSNAGVVGLQARGTSSELAFRTVGAERMRIGSNGGVDVGSTSGASAGGVSAYVADNDTAFYANGSNGRVNIKIHTEAVGGKIWYLRTGGTAHFGSGGGDFMVLNEEGTAIMIWDYSASTINGDFNDTSDVGLKENIVDITDAITTIKALKPRTFDWKEKTKLQGTHGFIAQEVETVLPNDVVGENYDADNPEHGSKALNTSGLLAVAVKAIQEQQVLIEALQKEVEELKGG